MRLRGAPLQFRRLLPCIYSNVCQRICCWSEATQSCKTSAKSSASLRCPADSMHVCACACSQQTRLHIRARVFCGVAIGLSGSAWSWLSHKVFLQVHDHTNNAYISASCIRNGMHFPYTPLGTLQGAQKACCNSCLLTILAG